jgi:hypothetical protein
MFQLSILHGYLPGNALQVRVRVAGALVKPQVPAAA